MNYCPSCGNKITQSFQYCPKCGYSLHSLNNQNRLNIFNFNSRKQKIVLYCYILYFLILLCILIPNLCSGSRYNREVGYFLMIVFGIIVPMIIYGFYYVYLNYKKNSNSNLKRLSNVDTSDITNSNADQSSNNCSVTIKDSWSLMDFAKIKGKMQVGHFLNKETNEKFKACIFTNSENEKTYVAFSMNIGELTPNEIAQNKDKLRIALLASGNYCLYLSKPDEVRLDDDDLPF